MDCSCDLLAFVLFLCVLFHAEGVCRIRQRIGGSILLFLNSRGKPPVLLNMLSPVFRSLGREAFRFWFLCFLKLVVYSQVSLSSWPRSTLKLHFSSFCKHIFPIYCSDFLSLCPPGRDSFHVMSTVENNKHYLLVCLTFSCNVNYISGRLCYCFNIEIITHCCINVDIIM